MTIAAPQTAERVQRSFTSRSQIAVLLQEARARTLQLIETVSEADLRAQHDPLMGPILWDLGHIGHFEELWLDRNLDGKVEFVEMPGMYNPFEHPRRVRGALPLPTLGATLDSMTEIRERVLERLARVDLESEDPLLRGGYVYQMVLQHEYQHNETMLQTLQLKAGAPYTPGTRREPPPVALPNGSRAEMVRVDLPNATVGTDDRLRAYDNERPRHVVDLSPFWIDRTPVTNKAYLAFIDDGGYRRRELWSEAGRAWLDESKAEAPKYWTRDHRSWLCRSMDRVSPPELAAPVIHVCYHEAEAFARWAGKRLPTEREWEIAAAWDAARSVARDYPWGDVETTPREANVDQLVFDVAPIDTYQANVAASGCYGM